MTRLFLEGRTETVRPVTMESAAFVRAMCNPESNVSTCTCDVHVCECVCVCACVCVCVCACVCVCMCVCIHPSIHPLHTIIQYLYQLHRHDIIHTGPGEEEAPLCRSRQARPPLQDGHEWQRSRPTSLLSLRRVQVPQD